MRTALISDIHGNLDGLAAVLADSKQRQCGRILCLGDLIDGGPDSVEVVRLFQERSLLCVQGNHDEYPSADLPREIEAYLQALPEEIVEGSAAYMHTSPRLKKSKISDAIEAWNVFEETDLKRIFVGDVHVPLLFGSRCSEKVSATSYPIPYDEEFVLDPDDRYIICPGAVGYSRDGYHWLRYAIYDDIRDSITFYAPAGPILMF